MLVRMRHCLSDPPFMRLQTHDSVLRPKRPRKGPAMPILEGLRFWQVVAVIRNGCPSILPSAPDSNTQGLGDRPLWPLAACVTAPATEIRHINSRNCRTLTRSTRIRCVGIFSGWNSDCSSLLCPSADVPYVSQDLV